ncbi:maltokinase N-terminal cap-like domain-containing protein [Cryptosporangium minutisporangium]|uniref:Maltokinase N-terminal cap domain-containing protein n=1 Tax=Cryptosporangium minutisporangium TaxID=113569 RepID=A0ABP6T184_9ACTN
MAIVHDTTLVPSKLELLTEWLPRQPWYVGSGTLDLARAGGFRLDDPAGEVGIEVMVVTDIAGSEVVSYLVPLTYRGAPLPGGEAALVGTSEHGVLGKRFFYDAPADPVFRAELRALVRGQTQAQAQRESDTPDPTVLVGAVPDAADVEVVRVLVASDAVPAPGEVAVPWQLPDGHRVRGVVARAS